MASWLKHARHVIQREKAYGWDQPYEGFQMARALVQLSEREAEARKEQLDRAFADGMKYSAVFPVSGLTGQQINEMAPNAREMVNATLGRDGP